MRDAPGPGLLDDDEVNGKRGEGSTAAVTSEPLADDGPSESKDPLVCRLPAVLNDDLGSGGGVPPLFHSMPLRRRSCPLVRHVSPWCALVRRGSSAGLPYDELRRPARVESVNMESPPFEDEWCDSGR